MITQSILDFMRDVIVNWISGASSVLGGLDLDAAGAGLGNAASGVGSVLALFLAPGLWGVVAATFGVFLTTYLVTALVAILGRRMASK